MEATAGVEPAIEVLQTSALPLGYVAKKLERETGFEPATATLARWGSTTELLPLKCLLVYQKPSHLSIANSWRLRGSWPILTEPIRAWRARHLVRVPVAKRMGRILHGETESTKETETLGFLCALCLCGEH